MATACQKQNIERYFSIVHPFWYQRRVSPKAVFALTVVFWVFWTPICFLSFINGNIERSVLSACSAVVCITIIFVYGRIFQIARKKRRSIATPSVIELTIRDNSGLDIEKTPQTFQRPSKFGEALKDIKLAKMFIILVICSQICYLPNVAYHIYLRMQNSEIKTESSLIIRNWVVTFISMNSTLNSLVFFWKNSQLRHEMLSIIKSR